MFNFGPHFVPKCEQNWCVPFGSYGSKCHAQIISVCLPLPWWQGVAAKSRGLSQPWSLQDCLLESPLFTCVAQVRRGRNIGWVNLSWLEMFSFTAQPGDPSLRKHWWRITASCMVGRARRQISGHTKCCGKGGWRVGIERKQFSCPFVNMPWVFVTDPLHVHKVLC